MAAKVLGGVFNEKGEESSKWILEGNALRTESDVRTNKSVVAIDKITRIRCFDVSPSFPVKSVAILAIIAIVLFLVGSDSGFSVIGIIPAAIAVFMIYSYYQNKGTYELAIELSSGSTSFIQSKDIAFLDNTMNLLFNAVQDGTKPGISITIDARTNTIKNEINNTGATFNDRTNIGNMN